MGDGQFYMGEAGVSYQHEKAAIMKYLFDAKENYLKDTKHNDGYLERMFSALPPGIQEPVITRTSNDLTTKLYQTSSAPMPLFEDKFPKGEYISVDCDYK
jgi:hypothetical protein